MLSGMTRGTLRTTPIRSYSIPGARTRGVTWAPNVAVSNPFNPFEGYPNQNKIGDYITIVSDNTGGNVAYSATFNFNSSRSQHEEDVYYVRVFPSGGGTPTPTPTASPHDQRRRQPAPTATRYSDADSYGYAHSNTQPATPTATLSAPTATTDYSRP